MTTESCAGHACDCVVGHALPATGPYAGSRPVTLWSSRRHVRAQVSRLLGRADTSASHDPGELGELLDRVLPGLTSTERSELVVVHRSAEGPDDVEPALSARLRLDTPWVPGLLEPGVLHPWFQPIVDVRTGVVHGREALLRVPCDGRVRLGTEVVAAARAHGSIYALDQVARTQAICHGGPSLPPGETLYVNFMPTVVYDPARCLRSTWAAIERAGVEPDRLCFEVAESEQFPDLDHLTAILDTYRDRGARVALDDLGAGWTSLNYVRQLRPDVVKLDRELVTGLHTDPARERLVHALVDYAHELGIRVVAEGIEDVEDLVVAHRLDVDLAQGYLLGEAEPTMEPLSAEAIAVLAKARPPSTP